MKIYLDEDSRLMLEAAKGDGIAYNKLYEKYLPIITRYAARRNGHNGSSEDIAQEVLIRIYDDRADYRPTAAFKTYLFTYAKNVLSEYRRQGDKEITARQLWLLKQGTSISANQVEIIEKIQEIMSHLTVKQLQAVALLYYAGLPFSEAAKSANCTEKAFEKRLARAYKRLKKGLSDINSKKF